MTPTIDALISEARDAHDRFWFVRDLNIVEQTNATVTLHLTIGSDLFVQVFLSQNSQRRRICQRCCGGDRRVRILGFTRTGVD
jgi:primosomal replication protein N